MKWPVWVVLVSLGLAGCRALDPNYSAKSQPDSVIRLVFDSVRVRDLVAKAARRDEQFLNYRRALPREESLELTQDMMEHPDRYMVERKKFLADMAREPGALITGEQYFRILEQSEARCARDPHSTLYYFRFRVTTGPSKGLEGRACDDDVKPTGGFL